MNFQKLTFSIIFLLFQINAFGQIVVSLDNLPSDISCNDVWVENNLDLKITTTTASDCFLEDKCSFWINSASVLSLEPARLVVDLSSLSNITKVEIDVLDSCEFDCTRAFLIDAAGESIVSEGNTVISSLETLSVHNLTNEPLSELAISSCEGQIHEIRIFQSNVTLQESDLIVYPNPSKVRNNLYCRISNKSNWTSLERIDIFSLRGERVYGVDINSSDISYGLIKVQAPNLAERGRYIIRFKLENQLFWKSILRL